MLENRPRIFLKAKPVIHMQEHKGLKNTMLIGSHTRTLFTIAVLAVVVSSFWMQSICHGQSISGESKDQHRPWQVGVVFSGGWPPNYTMANTHVPVSAKVQLQMYSFGLEMGRSIGEAREKGILRGQMALRAEVIPAWIARYPPQNVAIRYGDGSRTDAAWKGQNFFGSSITPLLLRWNFESKASSTFVPWIQMGAGVLWTNHKFPMTLWAAPASTFNFTPQVGAGMSVLQHSKRSIEVGVKVVHISNAGLGDSNPGINQALMGSIGYSWWWK